MQCETKLLNSVGNVGRLRRIRTTINEYLLGNKTHKGGSIYCKFVDRADKVWTTFNKFCRHNYY